MSQVGTFSAPSGMDSARLFPLGSDTITATASSIVPGTNDPTLYTITFSGVAAGVYRMVLYDGGLALAVEDRVRVTSDSVEAVAADSSVTVLPATGIAASRQPGITLYPKVGETITQSITVFQSDGVTAVDLSGKTLEIVFEDRRGVDVVVIQAADITISGLSSNVVTFSYPSAVTASERVLKFALRDEGEPRAVYLEGIASVTRAPQVDL